MNESFLRRAAPDKNWKNLLTCISTTTFIPLHFHFSLPFPIVVCSVNKKEGVKTEDSLLRVV